jgi:hypothetical protein
LVASIGDESYISLAKGPLTPLHSLILPIAHLPASTYLSPAAIGEIRRVKTALRSCLLEKQQVPVFFERFVPTRGVQHMHIQCLPIPIDMSAGVAASFHAAAAKLEMALQPVPLSQIDQPTSVVGDTQTHFVWIELPDQSALWCPIPLELAAKINPKLIQFGRDVVARYINLETRADWKACQLDKAQETSMTDALKEALQPFDPYC